MDKDENEKEFLKQFPYLSVFFKMNTNLTRKMGRQKGFTLENGGFISPTCCAMLINFAQFQFTL